MAAKARIGVTRVAINGRFLTSPQSGVQRVARELTLALDHVLTERPSRKEWTLFVPEAAEVPHLDAIRVKRLSGPKGTLWEQTALALAARGALLLNFANTAPLLHRRSVVLMHDAQVWDSPESYGAAFRTWYKLMQPRVARNAVGLVSVSQHSAQRLATHGIAEVDRFTVIPNGLDHILAHPADTSSAQPLKPFILAMAGSQRHKNLSFLIDLFSDARLSHLHLALVGTSTPSDTPRNVTFLGRVSDSELRGLFESAQLFLFPSITEGFGLPPGEAMLCGCPVIAASGGALSEVYEGAATLLGHSDKESWIDAILRLAADEGERQALAACGQTVAQRITWRAAAEKYLELVESL